MRRFARTYLWLFGLLLLVSSGFGCTAITGVRDYLAYDDSCNDFVLGYRNQVWARQSWHENRAAYLCEPYRHDFGEGYRAGYRDVASGGSGCPPAVPPRCYWSWKYQTPEGQAKVAAWFSGYPLGAAAAEQDMAGRWQQIQVSKQIELQYSDAFENGTIFMPRELLEEAPPLPAEGLPPPSLPTPNGSAPEEIPLPGSPPVPSATPPLNSSTSFQPLPVDQGSGMPGFVQPTSFGFPNRPRPVPSFRPQGSLPDDRTAPLPFAY